MTPLVQTYAVYLAISAAFTVWVARTLHENGRVFLLDVFRGNTPLADSVNRLLVVGFYLVNTGFICLNLRLGIDVNDAASATEALSGKVGLVVLVLGGMHFFNLAVFALIRRATSLRDAPLPYAPDAVLPAGPAKA